SSANRSSKLSCVDCGSSCCCVKASAMPRMRMLYNLSIVCWLSIVLLCRLRNYRRIGLRRAIKVIGATDVVVVHGSLGGRIARYRHPVELVLEDRVHAGDVVGARPQASPGCRF